MFPWLSTIGDGSQSFGGVISGASGSHSFGGVIKSPWENVTVLVRGVGSQHWTGVLGVHWTHNCLPMIHGDSIGDHAKARRHASMVYHEFADESKKVFEKIPVTVKME